MSGAFQGLTAALVVSAASAIGAQSPVRQAGETTSAQIQARQQISTFEGALENAVRYGAQMLNQRLQASNTDNMVMLAGLTRARGFRLQDYGVVFDVEFPSMRRSMVWTIQELEKANAARAVRAAEPAPAPVIRPREIYQTEIANALVSAIIDYPGSVGIGSAEWLTVAARESLLDRRLLDPNDTAITVILRIKGSDLQALHDRTITREEGLKRVEVKHY